MTIGLNDGRDPHAVRRVLVETFADAADVFGSPEGQYLNDAEFHAKVETVWQWLLQHSTGGTMPNFAPIEGEPDPVQRWYIKRFGIHDHPPDFSLNIAARAHARCIKVWTPGTHDNYEVAT